MSIPMEVFEDILSRIPVKPLLRFRCVSPPWRDLIDSADFVKLHLARTIEADSHLNVILCSDPYPHPRAAKLEPASLALEITELQHHPFRDEMETEIQVWGSCNGLLCMKNEFDTISLWNPSTREYLKLPSLESQFKTEGYAEMSIFQDRCGFGYDQASDDYKVLNIMDVQDDRTGLQVAYLVKIYSVKSNLWSPVEQFKYSKFPYINRKPGVLASGALHWLMGLERNKMGTIVAFDVAKEEWDTVPIAFLGVVDCHLFLECYQDSLCLVSDHQMGYIDIWVMKEYWVEESWTRLFSLCHEHQITRPVYFPKNSGEVFMQHAGGLIWFDAVNSKPWYHTVHDTVHEHRKNIEARGLNKFLQVEVYHESLVRLVGFRKMKYEKKQKGKRKSEMAGFLSKGFKLKL